MAPTERAATPPGNNLLPILVVVALRRQLLEDFSLVRWIRAQPELGETPVFVLSGVGLNDEERKAHNLGSDCYAQKPLKFKTLVEIVEGIRDRWIADSQAN